MLCKSDKPSIISIIIRVSWGCIHGGPGFGEDGVGVTAGSRAEVGAAQVGCAGHSSSHCEGLRGEQRSIGCSLKPITREHAHVHIIIPLPCYSLIKPYGFLGLEPFR